MRPTFILYLAIGVFFLPVCTSQAQAGELEAAFMRVMESIEHGDFEAFRKLQVTEADQDPSLLKSRFDQIVAYYQRYRSGESKVEFRKGNMPVELDQKLVQVRFFEGRDSYNAYPDLFPAQSPLYIIEPSIVSMPVVIRHSRQIEQHGHDKSHPTRAGPNQA